MALFSRQAIFGLLEETITRSGMGVMRRDALAHRWWYTSAINDQSPRAYNAEVAQDSWQRVLAFFEEHVK